MNISVCLEHDGSCLMHIPIFENTKIPKYQCNWSSGLTLEGMIFHAAYCYIFKWGRHDRDRMVVGFTATYAFSN
jgi:hypothetical protein